MKQSRAYLYSRTQWKIIHAALCCLLLLVLAITPSAARTEGEEGETSVDEISVFVNVQMVGSVEVPAIIRDQVVYLPITEIFNYLRIKNVLSPGMDSVTGYFIDSDAPFTIDKVNSHIIYRQKLFELHPGDLIKTETNLYLRSEYLGQVFGLDCKFNFRSLSVTLTTKLELPVVREMRQELMRKNIKNLKGDMHADTTYRQTYPMLNIGMADWSVIALQQLQGADQTLLNLSLGGVVAGGETNVSLNYNSAEPFNAREQYYLWRLVHNNNPVLKQVIAGKILTQATSSIYSPVVGIQLTNAPTSFRRSFGSYTLSNTTQPGWIVELYVNNVLVDYAKADGSGFFSFQVPLVYGTSEVRLRYYGPWGEERSQQEFINIPFNFLPPGQAEYTVSAGVVEDGKDSRFSRGILSYGLSRRWTVGGGAEYLSSIRSGSKVLPFINTSVRVTKGLLFSGDYTHGVRAKGILTYTRPSNLQIELNYIRYKEGQTAINYSYQEERKLIVSSPIRARGYSLFSRLTLDQIILPFSRYTTAEWLMSGAVFGVGTHLSTYALFTHHVDPFVYTNLSLAFRLPKGFLLTPQLQYGFTDRSFISLKWVLEKHVFTHGYVNLSYEENFKSSIRSLGIDLRYDLSFAQIGFSTRRTNKATSLLESARGSLMADPRTKYVGLNSRTSVGRGGIVIKPFLDLNCNGVRDEGEPRANGLKLQTNGGRIQVSPRDSCIRIFDLEPYASYILELDRNSFDNIGWQLKKSTIKVVVDPNQFKQIEVPIAVVAEVSGTVFLSNKAGKNGQGQIMVSFYKEDSILIARTMSEPDGFFSYLGLAPGQYTVRVDSGQLRKLNMVAEPAVYPLNISRNREGDVIDELEFTIKSRIPDTATVPTPAKATQDTVIKVKATRPARVSSRYGIQVASCRSLVQANKLRRTLLRTYRKPVIIINQNGYYKVRVIGFMRRGIATRFRQKMAAGRYKDCFVVRQKD